MVNTYNYADFGKRLGAFFIDFLIICVANAILYAIIPAFMILFGWAIGWMYFALLESSPKMATLGKQAVGIVVTDMNGNRITFGRATGRYFGKILSGLILCIGYLMMLWSDTKQTLHDQMAGTLVLNGKVGGNYNYAPSPSPAYTPSPSFGGGPMLYCVAGEFVGKSFPIQASGLTLGRDASNCQVIFSTTSEGISRVHCSIYFNAQNGLFVLTDAGSTYGTFHEKGMKLTQGQSITLRPGERFYLATRSNMFEVRL